MCHTQVLIEGAPYSCRSPDEIKARIGWAALEWRDGVDSLLYPSHGCLCGLDLQKCAESAGFAVDWSNAPSVVVWKRQGARLVVVK